jgi:predicted RNase H-like nuclease (RuvC/YqgF family)
MPETASKWAKIPSLLGKAVKFLPMEAPWVGIVVELVSHLTASMGATSSDSKETLRNVEALHSDMTEMIAAHVSLGTKLDQQAARLDSQVTALNLHTKALASLNEELAAAHTTAEGLRTRLETLENRATLMGGVGIALLVVVCALSIVLLVHLRR